MYSSDELSIIITSSEVFKVFSYDWNNDLIYLLVSSYELWQTHRTRTLTLGVCTLGVCSNLS